MIKFKTLLRWGILIVLIIVMIGILVLYCINGIVKNSAEKNLDYVVKGQVGFSDQQIEKLQSFQADCIMVLGAGIKDAETPSDMLRDRLDVGIALYKQKVAPKLLLTGDNGQIGYNEIHVMLNYAKDAGVPEEDIFCDHAGFSTFDSMYRASSIFEANKMIVVTQQYHEYRALYLGKELGMQVLGVASDQKSYRGSIYREVREILARLKDFFKVKLGGEALLGGEAIPINGSGLISHGE